MIQELLINKLSEENIEKINKLETLGYNIRYDKKNGAFKIFTDDTEKEFFVLSEDTLIRGAFSPYLFGLIPFYNDERKSAYKILSNFAKLKTSAKNMYRNDMEAAGKIPMPETLSGGLEYLLYNRKRAEILSVLVPGSTTAKKVLELYDSFIDQDYLELPVMIEYKVKKDELIGSDRYTYTPYVTLALYSGYYNGRKVKYTLFPYALSKESIGKGTIEIMSKVPGEKIDIHDERLDPEMKELITGLEKFENI